MRNCTIHVVKTKALTSCAVTTAQLTCNFVFDLTKILFSHDAAQVTYTHFINSLKIAKYMSRLMGKPTICIGENKDADQLRGNREADQRLCFRYSDSTIPPLLNCKISSF